MATYNENYNVSLSISAISEKKASLAMRQTSITLSPDSVKTVKRTLSSQIGVSVSFAATVSRVYSASVGAAVAMSAALSWQLNRDAVKGASITLSSSMRKALKIVGKTVYTYLGAIGARFGFYANSALSLAASKSVILRKALTANIGLQYVYGVISSLKIAERTSYNTSHQLSTPWNSSTPNKYNVQSFYVPVSGVNHLTTIKIASSYVGSVFNYCYADLYQASPTTHLPIGDMLARVSWVPADFIGSVTPKWSVYKDFNIDVTPGGYYAIKFWVFNSSNTADMIQMSNISAVSLGTVFSNYYNGTWTVYTNRLVMIELNGEEYGDILNPGVESIVSVDKQLAISYTLSAFFSWLRNFIFGASTALTATKEIVIKKILSGAITYISTIGEMVGYFIDTSFSLSSLAIKRAQKVLEAQGDMQAETIVIVNKELSAAISTAVSASPAKTFSYGSALSLGASVQKKVTKAADTLFGLEFTNKQVSAEAVVEVSVSPNADVVKKVNVIFEGYYEPTAVEALETVSHGEGVYGAGMHTTDTGTDLLVLCLHQSSEIEVPITNVKFNGISLTTAVEYCGNPYAAIFFLKNPPIGTYEITYYYSTGRVIQCTASNYKNTAENPLGSTAFAWWGLNPLPIYVTPSTVQGSAGVIIDAFTGQNDARKTAIPATVNPEQVLLYSHPTYCRNSSYRLHTGEPLEMRWVVQTGTGFGFWKKIAAAEFKNDGTVTFFPIQMFVTAECSILVKKNAAASLDLAAYHSEKDRQGDAAVSLDLNLSKKINYKVGTPIKPVAIEDTQTYTTTSTTQAHTVPASGENRALMVVIQGAQSTSNPIMSYAGVSMTRVDFSYGGLTYVAIFYLLNPATGTNNLVYSSSRTNTISAFTLSNVNQTTPLGAFGKYVSISTNPVTVNLDTKTEGSLFLSGFSCGESSNTSLAVPGAGQIAVLSLEADENVRCTTYEPSIGLPDLQSFLQGSGGNYRHIVSAEFLPTGVTAPTSFLLSSTEQKFVNKQLAASVILSSGDTKRIEGFAEAAIQLSGISHEGMALSSSVSLGASLSAKIMKANDALITLSGTQNKQVEGMAEVAVALTASEKNTVKKTLNATGGSSILEKEWNDYPLSGGVLYVPAEPNWLRLTVSPSTLENNKLVGFSSYGNAGGPGTITIRVRVVQNSVILAEKNFTGTYSISLSWTLFDFDSPVEIDTEQSFYIELVKIGGTRDLGWTYANTPNPTTLSAPWYGGYGVVRLYMKTNMMLADIEKKISLPLATSFAISQGHGLVGRIFNASFRLSASFREDIMTPVLWLRAAFCWMRHRGNVTNITLDPDVAVFVKKIAGAEFEVGGGTGKKIYGVAETYFTLSAAITKFAKKVADAPMTLMASIAKFISYFLASSFQIIAGKVTKFVNKANDVLIYISQYEHKFISIFATVYLLFDADIYKKVTKDAFLATFSMSAKVIKLTKKVLEAAIIMLAKVYKMIRYFISTSFSLLADIIKRAKKILVAKTCHQHGNSAVDGHGHGAHGNGQWHCHDGFILWANRPRLFRWKWNGNTDQDDDDTGGDDSEDKDNTGQGRRL